VGGGAGRLARRQLDHALRLAETRELLARRAEGLARSTRLLGKLPRNARYAGFTRQLPGDLANTYPAGVRFNSAGFPDFRPYATRRVELDGLTGGRGDFARANAASGLRQTPRGMTWHHVEDGRTLLLVPTRLHQAVGHTGGAKIVQVLSGLSDAERSEWIAWLQGETPP